MNDARRELWARFMAGEALSPAEERELQEALRQDPSIAEDVEIDGLLRALPAEEDPEPFVRAFSDAAAAEKDGEQFVEKFRARAIRAPRRRPGSPPGSSWIGAVAVLLAAAAALLFLLWSGGPEERPARRPGEAARSAPVPEPEEAPRHALVREEKPPAPPPPRPPPEPAPLVIPSRPPTAVPDPKPVPLPEPVPTPTPPPADPARPRTIVVAGTLERVEGEAGIVEGGVRTVALAGASVPAGAAIATTGARSSLTFRFEDGTSLMLAGDTIVRDLADREAKAPRGKRAFVAQGMVEAEITKQPADQPMIFTTPHAEARVVGTTLKLLVDAVGKNGTRLEVPKGRCEFRRTGEIRSVLVVAGNFAVAAPATVLVARPLASAPAQRTILLQMDFEDPSCQKDWQNGTFQSAVTHGRSKGAMKAASAQVGDFTASLEAAYSPKPLPFTVTDRTMFTFAYYVSAPPGEIKAQFRRDRTSSKVVIGYILPEVKVREWTVVTVRMAEVFRTESGAGDLVKIPILEIDDLQFHAGTRGKNVEFYLDSVAIYE